MSSTLTLPAAALCTTCGVERRVTGTLGAGDGAAHLTLGTCGHVVPRTAAVTETAVEHTVDVVAGSMRYPYKAACACGWASNTYVAAHAAQMMGDAHLAEVI